MEQQTFFAQDAVAPWRRGCGRRRWRSSSGSRTCSGQGKVLRRLIESDHISSMIFWGPPGVGKTTLARIIANRTKAAFIDFSAVTSGIKEIREVMQQAEDNRRFGERTIVFVDEIHRFNKAQQDAFLPFVEKGSIILIGATTENPSFEVNGALLSRCKVFVLQALTDGRPGFAALTRADRPARLWRHRRSTCAGDARGHRQLCQRRRPHRAFHAGDGGAERRGWTATASP